MTLYLAVDDRADHKEFYLNSIDPLVDVVDSIEAMAGMDKETLSDLSKYSAALVDFDLDFRGPADRSPIRLADGTPVTTGIGVMAWLRERRPGLPLMAVTHRGDNHAPWFMCGAFLWFSAPPLDVREVAEVIEQKSSSFQLMVSAAGHPDSPSLLFEDTQNAAHHFQALLNTSLDNRAERETLRWLGLLAGLSNKYIPTSDIIQREVRAQFGIPGYNAAAHRIPGQLFRMQQAIANMWAAFGYQNHADGWPNPDDGQPSGDLRMAFYKDGCPVLTEVSDRFVRLFVTAPDVLKVQRDYRARISTTT